MKILYTLSGTSVTDGSSKSFMAMLDEVHKYQHEVAVICPNNNGLYNVLKERNIRVYYVPYRQATLPPKRNFNDILKWIPRFGLTMSSNTLALFKVRKFLMEFKPDIVHENSSSTDIGYKIAVKLKIPCVVHIREYGDKDFGLNLYNLKKRLADSKVFSIPITKDIAKHRSLTSNKRTYQIYNGIINKSQIRYNPNKERYILYAGRIEPAKGIDDMLEAYSRYCNDSVISFPLKIAGACFDNKYLSTLKRKVSALGIEDKVEWLGERKDIDDLFFKASITVIPSLFEGLGRILPEAMANGCLCVARNTGGLKEQIETGKLIAGQDIALSFEDTKELIQIFNNHTKNVLHSTPFKEGGEYYQMIIASQKAIQLNFTIESFGKKLEILYQKIYHEFH